MRNEALSSKATDAEKTWDGPAKSVQIPMPSGDGFKAQTIVGASNEFSLSSNAKITTEAYAQTHLDVAKEGHIGFANAAFDSVGGATFARAASAGATSIGAHGATSFHRAAGASLAKLAMEDSINEANTKANSLKKREEVVRHPNGQGQTGAQD